MLNEMNQPMRNSSQLKARHKFVPLDLVIFITLHGCFEITYSTCDPQYRLRGPGLSRQKIFRELIL